MRDDSDDMVLQDSLDIVGLKDYGKLKAAGRAQGWLVDPSQVTLGHVIGEGSFGSTYKGIWRGADCAVKIVKPSGEVREVLFFSLLRSTHASERSMYSTSQLVKHEQLLYFISNNFLPLSINELFIYE